MLQDYIKIKTKLKLVQILIKLRVGIVHKDKLEIIMGVKK